MAMRRGDNLMALPGKEDDPHTGAIDWGFMGVGAVGEDLVATVVSMAIWFPDFTPDQLPALETIVLDGYMDGLRQTGWRGDPSLFASVICVASPCAMVRIPSFPRFWPWIRKLPSGWSNSGVAIDEWPTDLLSCDALSFNAPIRPAN